MIMSRISALGRRSYHDNALRTYPKNVLVRASDFVQFAARVFGIASSSPFPGKVNRPESGHSFRLPVLLPYGDRSGVLWMVFDFDCIGILGTPNIERV
jgi:hypothetical protein